MNDVALSQLTKRKAESFKARAMAMAAELKALEGEAAELEELSRNDRAIQALVTAVKASTDVAVGGVETVVAAAAELARRAEPPMGIAAAPAASMNRHAEQNPLLTMLLGGRSLEEHRAETVKRQGQMHRLIQAGWRPRVEGGEGVRQAYLYPTQEELETGVPKQVRRRGLRLRPE